MSESDAHRLLVLRTADAIRRHCTSVTTVLTDVLVKAGDPVPPLVEGYRPDLYAISHGSNVVVLGEIETLASMRSRHTVRQLGSFLRHLDGRRARGCFVLAAEGSGADRAKVLLRFLVTVHCTRPTNILVYDGLDFWRLGGALRWHLL